MMHVADKEKKKKREKKRKKGKKRRAAATFIFHLLSLSLRDHLLQRHRIHPLGSRWQIEISSLFAGSENDSGRRRRSPIISRSLNSRYHREFNHEGWRNALATCVNRSLPHNTFQRLW